MIPASIKNWPVEKIITRETFESCSLYRFYCEFQCYIRVKSHWIFVSQNCPWNLCLFCSLFYILEFNLPLIWLCNWIVNPVQLSIDFHYTLMLLGIISLISAWNPFGVLQPDDGTIHLWKHLNMFGIGLYWNYLYIYILSHPKWIILPFITSDAKH